MKPALFKAVPVQTVEQRLYDTRCPVSEDVAGVPCCSTLYLIFMPLGVFLLVGVPDSWCILQCREYHSDRGGSLDLGDAESDLKFLRRKPTVPLPLAATVSAWFLQERSTVMVTPKYLLDLATTSCCP